MKTLWAILAFLLNCQVPGHGVPGIFKTLRTENLRFLTWLERCQETAYLIILILNQKDHLETRQNFKNLYS